MLSPPMKAIQTLSTPTPKPVGADSIARLLRVDSSQHVAFVRLTIRHRRACMYEVWESVGRDNLLNEKLSC